MSTHYFEGPGADDLKRMMRHIPMGPGVEDLLRILGIKPKAPDPKKPDPKTKNPKDSLRKGGGGLSAAAKKIMADRKQAEQPYESTLEIFEFPTVEQPKPEEKVAVESAVISDEAWHFPDTLFHEEAEVSIKLALPKGKEHITRFQVDLFAKTPSGPEPISKGEGWAQDDGTGKAKVPVYKPKGHDEGPVEYFFRVIHSLAKMVSTEMLPRTVSEMALKSADHILISGATFEKDSSFIGPKGTQALKPLEAKFNEWEKKYPKKAQIAVFGHTDKGEKDAKGLSERRAQSAFAFITNDATTWDNLYRAEAWGLKALQTLLKDLGHYNGKADGEDGPKTQAAFKAFQKGAGLPESGSEDSTTRKALFAAYMKGKHDIKIDASRFLKVAGHEWMGCAAHNQVKVSEGAAPENRRVAFVLINPSKHFPVNFPCRDGSEEACQGQCKKAGKRSGAGIKCLFYDQMVREEKQVVVNKENHTDDLKKSADATYDIDKAVEYLESNLFPVSNGKCAKHVRLAILAGGVKIYPNPVPAKEYGPYLIQHGFTQISQENYTPKKGDIAVIQPYPGGKPYGHITMYGGNIWLSDFAQNDMWSGGGYREHKPPYCLYRWGKND